MSMPHVLAPVAVGDPVTVAWHHDDDVVRDVLLGLAWAAWLRGVDRARRFIHGPMRERPARFADLGLDAPELLARDGRVKRLTKNGTVVLDCGLRFEVPGTPRGCVTYWHRGPGKHDTRFILAKRVDPLAVSVRVRVDEVMGHVVADFVDSRGHATAAAIVREVVTENARRQVNV